MAFRAKRILWPSLILPHMEPEPSSTNIAAGLISCAFSCKGKQKNTALSPKKAQILLLIGVIGNKDAAASFSVQN